MMRYDKAAAEEVARRLQAMDESVGNTWREHARWLEENFPDEFRLPDDDLLSEDDDESI